MSGQQKIRSRLYCNYCKQPAEKRGDLDERWLCATCRAIPGVRGWEDPKTRGIRGGSAEYMARTAHRLNVVTDDAPAPTPSASTPPTWKEFQALTRAQTDLTTGDKLMFVEVARHADYKTGANCAPPIAKMAAALSKSPRWVKLHLQRLRHAGVFQTIPLRSQHGWAQNLYRFMGHGFDCPLDCSNVKHVAPSRGPRPCCTRDAVSGRFRSEKLPLAKGKRRAPSIRDLRARGVPDIDLAVEVDLAVDLSREDGTSEGGPS